jgi:hypothetical protein
LCVTLVIYQEWICYVCRKYCGLVVTEDERIICENIKINLLCYFTLYFIGCQIRVLSGKIVVDGNFKGSNVVLAAENIYRTLSLRLCVIYLLEYLN